MKNLLPFDWSSPKPPGCHGVSRSKAQGGYLVSISLNRVQHHFGPFRTSWLEAATAHDRLVKYFLPFTRPKPILNTIAETFFKYLDSETLELYGSERISRLKEKLAEEALSAGIDLGEETLRRNRSISEDCFFNPKATENARASRIRSALRAMEVMALKNPKHDFIKRATALGISAEDRQDFEFDTQLKAVVAAYDKAQAELVTLIRLAKLCLDMNPDQTIR